MEDVEWREDELAAFRTEYTRTSKHTVKGRALRRAYLALLYAHYEGFCKKAWEEILIEVSRSGYPISRIRPSISCRFLKPEIAQLRSCSGAESVDTVLQFRQRLMDRIGPDYEKIETSNLWPRVLNEVLEDFGMSHSYVEEKSVTLNSLVARRNDIAHGENVGIDDNDLVAMHDAVWHVILELVIETVDFFGSRRFLIN